MLAPLIISVAPNGARRSKMDHPAIPLSSAEIADEAARCADEGAALLHLHVRDAESCGIFTVDAQMAAVLSVKPPAASFVGEYTEHP